MNEIIKQYNSIWETYIQGQQKYFSEKGDLPLSYIEDKLGIFENQKILDIGCGDGHDIAHFETKYNAEFYGIDSSEFMVEQAKKIVKNSGNVIVWNFEQLLFENDSFDIVYAKYAFSYIENFDRLYSEVSRVLKKWWKFIFIQNHPINDFTRKKEKYPIKEIIHSKLFSSNTDISYYNHTFGEIISKIFLTHFGLDDFTEDYMFRVLYPIPVFVGVTAIKK